MPDEEGYQDFINNAAMRLASVAEGPAFVLFTPYQSLTTAYNAAKDDLAPRHQIKKSCGRLFSHSLPETRTRFGVLENIIKDTRY